MLPCLVLYNCVNIEIIYNNPFILITILFQWEERESSNKFNENSNGNFKVPYAKKNLKEVTEASPVKKLRTSKYKLYF